MCIRRMCVCAIEWKIIFIWFYFRYLCLVSGRCKSLWLSLCASFMAVICAKASALESCIDFYGVTFLAFLSR